MASAFPRPPHRTPEQEIEHLKYVIRTLIAWIAQSAGSPLSVANAEELIKMLDEPPKG